MKQKRVVAIVLTTLAVLFSLTGLLTRDACGKLVSPEVDVIPSEVFVGEAAVVTAKITVMLC